MASEESHLSDEQLLQAIDGELSPRDLGQVESHLAACWACRARRQEIESTIGEFVRLHRSLDARIPSADGPRAMLQARLGGRDRIRRRAWFEIRRPVWALAAAASVLMVGFAIAVVRGRSERPTHLTAVTIPDPSLTPGATVLFSQGQVCRESSAKNKAVPVALERRVFDEYGIRPPQPKAYEVDYLISPALGGADDIHNLWPQSNTETVWNARVKDALEDHLRELVCEGQLDLGTAQREIATNWIEAYKKYFHTERPLNLYRQPDAQKN